MLYKILIRKCHSLTSGMTPSRHLLSWLLRTCLAESSNPILASPMPPPRQTRSQTTIHARDITNAPLLPRLVTPMTRNPSPPRVPTRSGNLSPRNLSQYDFCGKDTVPMAIALRNKHWSQKHLSNAVIHPVTGK
jgi:hypothetical protein